MFFDRKEAFVLLEDGYMLKGFNFGKEGSTLGEVVFTTSMTGYQEILTDPSFKGQIVTMTYPLIGNVGVNEEDVESYQVHAAGFIILELSPIYSNWRAKDSLENYLKKENVVGIFDVDTRALTKHIREKGAMRGGIFTYEKKKGKYILILDKDKHLGFDNFQNLKDYALNLILESPKMEGLNLVDKVTTKEKFIWKTGTWTLEGYKKYEDNHFKFKVGVLDFGIRYNILRCMVDVGILPIVLPANTTAEEILKMDLDGLFLSCGPGDPAAVPYIKTLKELFEKFKKPIFGICLGHQLTALAFGGKTFKLKFGHRGANQPVLNLENKKVEITAQNHGFAVDIKKLPKDFEVSHISLNDKTLEGMKHKTKPIFTVQYHPESSPGPHDSRYLFKKFYELLEEHFKCCCG